MAETQVLRTSAIVRIATFAPPQHGPVKTGALPLVQVRQAPGGPQVQEGQQKPVEILPPRDAQSAVAIGGLPMVQVKMTQNGPQIDDGRDNPVLIKNAKHAGVSTGGLPMIQVKMDGGKPQVQTVPNVKGGPPRIPAATPALSAPCVPRAVGVHVTRVPAPPKQVALPSVPELSTDQLMLCRHLVDKYLGELRATDAASEEGSTGAENTKLAEATISTLDEVMVATAVRAEAEAVAATAAAVLPTQAFAAAASIAPAPSASYVAGRVGGGARAQSFVLGARTQRNSAMAPRRVARSGPPLPPVIVKMDGRQPVVVPNPVAEATPPSETAPVEATEDAPQV